MNRSSRFPAYAILGAMLLALGVPGGRLAQGTGERFFPETGYTVREPFLGFFEAHGGVNFFGYPITPAIPEPPYEIQCFQYACLRRDPLAPPDQAVRLLPIAEALGLGTPPIPPQRIPLGRPFRRYVPETGHTVSGMFLAFWLRHGGAPIMGNPISEPSVENGRMVQIFQRMKVEWDPVEQAVRPMNLGESYAHIRGFNPRVPARIFQTPSPLRIYIAVHRPVLASGDWQTITVFVAEENGQPVFRARVRIQITGQGPWLLETDETGKAVVHFPVGAFPSGTLVEVHGMASDGLRQAEAFSSFRIWP
ncbi:hypothetical protein [Thermoflexus sp.]|uniref:hypothetical protein n=1 Tax=Thermoflexus sp. TaxID=1969742 RepID=UPI0017E7299C|nr:hypothetical protein [Thermoflexus sp.]